MKTVHCQRLNKEAPGLTYAPLPGELGQKIFAHISQEAWTSWLKLQTMIINEHHLNLELPENRSFLTQCLQQYLFEGQDINPADVTPPKKADTP